MSQKSISDDSTELPKNKRSRSNSGSRSVISLEAVLKAVQDSEKRLLIEIKDMRSQLDSTVAELRREFDNKLNTLSSEVDKKIETALASADTLKCVELVNTVDALSLVTDLRIEALERNHVLRDVVITGIPFCDGENVTTYFSKICETISFAANINTVSTIFRLSPKSAASKPTSSQHAAMAAISTSSSADTATSTSSPANSISPPIIVKFINSDFSRLFMSCYLKYKTLNLADIGFSSASRIYVNENLTKPNRELFRHCLNTKKTLKEILNVFTKNGLVYIKFAGLDKPIYTRSINEFDKFCSNFLKR